VPESFSVQNVENQDRLCRLQVDQTLLQLFDGDRLIKRVDVAREPWRVALTAGQIRIDSLCFAIPAEVLVRLQAHLAPSQPQPEVPAAVPSHRPPEESRPAANPFASLPPDSEAAQNPFSSPRALSRPPATAMNTGLFLGLFMVLGILSHASGFVLFAVNMALSRTHESRLAIAWLLLAIGLTGACIISYLVVLCIFTYQSWNAIQKYHPRMTAGLAVGLSLIPLFNLFWMFQTSWGFAKDFNHVVRHLQALGEERVPRVPTLVPLWACILTLVSFIPLIGMITGLASWILNLVFVVQVCNGVNALRKIELGS